MRTRKSILLLVLLLIFLTCAFYYGWQFFQANEKIQAYIVDTIRPLIQNKFTIKSLRLALGAVHLKHVTIDFDQYKVEIDDIRLGYQFSNFIKYGFSPEHLANDILLSHPVLTIRNDATLLKFFQDSSFHQSPDSIGMLKTTSEPISLIQRMTISNGVIQLQDSLDQTIIIANDLRGWVNSANLNPAVGWVEGKLFSESEKNFSIKTNLNLLNGHIYQLEVDLNKINVGNIPDYFLPEDLILRDGILSGGFILNQNKTIALTGSVDIENGQWEKLNSPFLFEEVTAHIEFNQDSISISRLSQKLGEGHIQISGQIKNPTAPDLNLTAIGEQVELSILNEIFSLKDAMKLSGKSNFQIKIAGLLSQFTLAGFLNADLFKIYQFSGKNLKSQFEFRDSTLTITELKGEIAASEIYGVGNVSFSKIHPMLKADFHSNGDLSHLLQSQPLTGLISGNYTSEIKIDGTISEPDAQVRLSINLINQQKPYFLKNEFNYQNGTLKLIRNTTSDSQFTMEGEIRNVLQQPELNLQINNFHQFLSWLYPEKKSRFENKRMNLILKSNFTRSTLFMELFRKDDTKLFNLLASSTQRDSITYISGELFINPSRPFRLSSHFFMKRTPDQFILETFELGNFAKIAGSYHFKTDEMTGNLEIKEAPLSDLSSIFNPANYAKLQGKVNGKVQISGHRSQPFMNGNLEVKNGTFNKVGTYEGTISFNLENDVFFLSDLLVQKDFKSLLQARGYYNHQTDGISFYINSPGFELKDLLQATGIAPGWFSGKCILDLQLSNRLHEPIMRGKMNLSDGKIYRFHYDSLRCDFGETGRIEKSPHTGVIEVNRLHLIRKNVFNIFGKGFFPLSNQQEMNFSLNGKGNFLDILPELTSFFKKTTSEGQLKVKIGGNYKAVKFTEAELILREGLLDVESVFPKITDIDLQVHLHPENNFLELVNLSGRVRGELLQFSNMESVKLADHRPLTPFFLEELDLNFGTLIITTGSKGIPLNIPGAMEAGDLGWFEFTGARPDEEFYFTGPFEHPYARGQIKFRNVNFTYPFLESEIDTESVVTQVLESMYWDVDAVTVKDTRYIRKIFSGPDAVFVNLILNNDQKLHFQGSVHDESLRLEGTIEATRGNVEYLDFNFKMHDGGVQFDRNSIFPYVHGKARTTLIDTLGFSNDFWLTLYLIDPVTGEKRERGRWDEPNLYFELTSSKSNLGNTSGEILEHLGYSVKNFKSLMPDIIGIGADNLILNPIIRPFERKIERFFGLDFVQFRSRFARNLLERQFSHNPLHDDSRYALLRNTRLSVGKYLANQWFFLYTGELESSIRYRPSLPTLGLRHTFGLEYQISPNLFFEMEYDYNSLLLKNKVDKKFLLRHSFPF